MASLRTGAYRRRKVHFLAALGEIEISQYCLSSTNCIRTFMRLSLVHEVYNKYYKVKTDFTLQFDNFLVFHLI